MVSKTLKAVISGSFKATDGEIESFDRVTGIIPRLNTSPPEGEIISKAEQMIIRRYAAIWIGRTQKKGPDGQTLDEGKYKRVQKVRQVFIDSIEDNEENPDAVLSYVGKDIMEMNFEELQDLAAANDLSQIPLYKVNSLQHARRVAWSEWAIKINGWIEWVDPKAVKKQNVYDFRTQGFNPSKHPTIVADGLIRLRGEVAASIEETIEQEANEALGNRQSAPQQGSKPHMSLDQLRKVADSKKIVYHKTMGFNQLFQKVYGTAA